MIITLRARLLGLRSLTLPRSLPSPSGEANRAAGSCAFSTPRNLGLDPNIYEMGPTAPIRILASDAAHLQPRPLLERPISPLWLCSGTHTSILSKGENYFCFSLIYVARINNTLSTLKNRRSPNNGLHVMTMCASIKWPVGAGKKPFSKAC
jgi:hypothetical protein